MFKNCCEGAKIVILRSNSHGEKTLPFVYFYPMEIAQVTQQRILIASLNWGMGHVARSIALIHRLIQQQNTVFIACSKEQKAVFQSYFPTIETIFHADYPFQFSGKGTWTRDILKQRQPLLKRFVEEQKQVEALVEKYTIQLVISDHRYGFFSKNVPSIFVTHQLQLPLKWYHFFAQRFHESLLQNFQHLWVLDDEKQTHAGKLSAPIKHNSLTYIGILSRFELGNATPKSSDVTYIISGPQPYDELFFNSCIEKAKRETGKTKCITNRTFQLPADLPKNLLIYQNEDWIQIDGHILGAKKIVSRFGYSTWMDVVYLEKKAELIPTKNQAEQVYLAELHRDKI